MRVTLTGALAIVSVLTASAAAAQTVDEIVARHIATRGGYDKLKAIQTIEITRTVAAQFSDVKVVISRKRPQLYRVDQMTQAGVASARGVNADAAWDTAQGRTTIRSAALAAESRELDADFDGWLVDWREKGHTVSLEGKETLPGGEAYKLKVTTRSGAVRYVFLDTTTFLDRRHMGVLNLTQERQMNVVIDFSGWRSVDGVMFPFDISEDRTGKEPTVSYATYTEKITLNVPMNDDRFATPLVAK